AAKGAARAPAPLVVACLDARRGELYAAAHAAADPLAAPVWGPTVVPIEILAARLAAAREPVSVVGEGVAALAGALDAAARARVRWVTAPDGSPDAGWVGRLGAGLLATGAGIAPAALAPAYVRRAEAEVRRTGVRFEPA